MMKNGKYIIGLLLLVVGCSEWNEHYDEHNGGMEISDKHVWEFLQEKEEYAGFVSLLKETGLGDTLTDDKRYTIWVPGELADLASLTDSVKKLVVANHITAGDYYNSAFEEGLSLRTTAGKHVRLHAGASSSGFVLNGKNILKTNIACRNGVIHEIDGILELQPTLYEKMLEDSVRYGMIRRMVETFQVDTTYRYFITDTIQVPQLDTIGNPVYDEVSGGQVMRDSLVVDSIPRYTYGAYESWNTPIMRDDRGYFTLFLTDSVQLEQKITEYYELWSELNFPAAATGKDSLNLNRWIARGCYHKGLIEPEDYPEKDYWASAYGVVWPAYEKIAARPIECSNGYIYEVEDLQIPYALLRNSVSVSTITAYNENPDFIQVELEAPGGQDVQLKKEIRNNVLVLTAAPAEETEEVIPYTFRVSFDSYQLVQEAIGSSHMIFRAQQVVPGTYRVGVRYGLSHSRDPFRVYVNGSFVGKADLSKVTGDLQWVGRITIPVERGIQPVHIMLENTASANTRILSPVGIELEPVENNY